MIIGRIALFFALLFGVATTQLPEYVQQYRQRLGGAIDELTAIVTQFDQEAAAQGLSEEAGISRLEANADPLVKARGTDMAALIARLLLLKRAEAALDDPNAFTKWKTFALTFDASIAANAYQTFQPAVPATTEGLVAGLIGFIVGGGLMHVLGLPIRYRHKLFRRRRKVSAIAEAGDTSVVSGSQWRGRRR